MKNFDKIICGDSTKIGSMLTPNSVDLSIVMPPYVSLKDYYSKNKSDKGSVTSKYLDFIEYLLQEVEKVTKPGGICCLILSNEMDPKTDSIIPTAQATIVKILYPSDNTNWQMEHQITWVKTSQEKIESIGDNAETSAITFSETPYSVIYILMKKGKNEESISISDRLGKLRLSADKKIEMSDSVWHIQHSSEKGYKDHMPKELVIRLVLLFSQENDLVLDPFARYGIIPIVSKTLKRHFLCVEKNMSKVEMIRKRLKSIK